MGRPHLNLKGQKFGKLTALEWVPGNAKDHGYWICECECGNIVHVESSFLRRGQITRCKDCNFIDITGERFGRLIALERVGQDAAGCYIWKCICDCGNIVEVSGNSLRRGNTESCGCLQKEALKMRATKHGMYLTRIYSIWENMIARCENPSNRSYDSYGGRGIRVCEEWHDFQTFMNWAYENGYDDSLTIDRINVNGNYEPNNCRWITIKEQMFNKRTNRYVTYNNETKTVIQWDREMNYIDGTIGRRLDSGWTIEEAITIPVGLHKPITVIRKERQQQV